MTTMNRKEWLDSMLRIGKPVLDSLAEGKLKERMPVESVGSGREQFSHLEAIGRLLAGMAPWLESGPSDGEEGLIRASYLVLARQAIRTATDPESPDYMNFEHDFQPIVDAAFLAHAVIRAPHELGSKLEASTRELLASALKRTRSRKPHMTNWLLFSAMIEAALYKLGCDWDPMRVDYAVKVHNVRYLGDGTYADGPHHRNDYYNSYVIHPMLLDIVETVAHEYPDWESLRAPIQRRAIRQAGILERMISPEGTFPVIGRSLTYRFGAFQLLAQMALREQLPPDVSPEQVKCALSAVIARTMAAPGTFDENGWLQLGLCGHQPSLAESYISTGSLYLCSTVFLPLGLPAGHRFWTESAEWTSRLAWSGKDVPIDHAED